MTTKMILEAIGRWNEDIHESEKLVSFLEQGNCFTYDNISYGKESEYIHAYLGIHNEKLYFFLIPDAYDKPEYSTTFSDYVQACPVMWSLLGTHTIPDLEAEIRITRWIEQYKTWVPKQTAEPVGMFKAFNIPADDFESQECLATLALQLGGIEGAKTADLVIANANDKSIVQFDDFSQPVPPYGASAAASDFYLMIAASTLQ
ncbi:hypothetical protein [Flavobacterium sp.]